MALNPYLVFNGNAWEAALYYARVFGAEEPQLMTFGSVHSEGIPEEARDLIMHTFVEIAGGKLMISDAYPGMPVQEGNNFTIACVSKDERWIRNAFEELKKDGEVEMELQETFWNKAYGSLTDKFNIKWQFSLEA